MKRSRVPAMGLLTQSLEVVEVKAFRLALFIQRYREFSWTFRWRGLFLFQFPLGLFLLFLHALFLTRALFMPLGTGCSISSHEFSPSVVDRRPCWDVRSGLLLQRRSPGNVTLLPSMLEHCGGYPASARSFNS